MRNALAGAALVVFWSSGFIGAELGTSVAGADTLLAWRYLVVSAILLALGGGRVGAAGWRERPIPLIT